MLPSFVEEEEALQVIRKFNLAFCDLFVSLDHWIPSSNLSLRAVWIHSFGVP